LQKSRIKEIYNTENIIYDDLSFRKFNVDVAQVVVNEKGTNGDYNRKLLEVEFVANKGSKRYYVQSACMIPDKEK
jgi:hypothetical protein